MGSARIWLRMGIAGVQAPTRLGRYELLARLATGGMGEIFLARLEGAAGFEKLFVIKRILPHLADDARFRQMLIAEARLASKLSHANICQVYELGETDGQLYIVMEYLEGVTLLPLLRKLSKEQGQLDFGFVGGVMQQTTDALHYAHELKDRVGDVLGIVHRDVTPSNIFLTEAGVAKVLDFGIAKVKDASANTQTGTVKGKYAYMAPEQLRGTTLDRRADVFSLGVVLYEMLALRRLFQRKTDYLTFRAVMEQPIPDIRRYRPDVPDALALVLAQTLDRDPARRYDTARIFGSAVLDALTPLGRPWSQGEISDYVRREFADDIGKRQMQVATAVNKTNAGQRATMPLIAHEPGPATEIDDDDDEFPAVDSTITETPLEIRAVRPPQDSKDFASQTGQVTPPPFANESSTSGVSIKPIVGAGMSMPQAVVAKPSRSLVWPLFALAMVGIAGGALFLVWKQMQQQQQQPTTVNITSEPRDDQPVIEPDQESGSNTIAVTPDEPDRPDTKTAGKPPNRAKKDPYTEALRVQRPAVNKCAQEHGAPQTGVKVKILVATDGRVKGVTLEPAALNGTPLGACIKNVLSAAQFPKAQDDKEVTVSFRGAS
jgi:serine/threonine protein kinase